jgi:hypothetical protein
MIKKLLFFATIIILTAEKYVCFTTRALQTLERFEWFHKIFYVPKHLLLRREPI